MSLIIKMDTIKTEEHLKKAIPYIMNERKTNGLHYSNSGILPEQITNTFFMTKKRFPTRGNRQAYHYKFSFSKDEKISPEDAFSFIKEWVEGYLGDNYDFVCSVHLHMHLIFNSVCRTGGKYHYKKGDWNRIVKPLTNRLADKYYTGHLKEKDETLDYTYNYKKGKNGVDWQARVQNDMDQCISMSKSYSDFKKKMVTKFHYQLREGVSRDYGVYLSLMPPGKGKAIRSYRLDTGYMPVDIEAKIEERYIMSEIDEVQADDMVSYENSAKLHREISLAVQDRKLDWMMSRNYTFIPYQTLSDYQKVLVRRTLEAKRMYRRTGTLLQMHEQSVRTVKGMIGEMREMGVYRKIGGQQIQQSLKQKKPEQQKMQREVQREVRKWRQK